MHMTDRNLRILVDMDDTITTLLEPWVWRLNDKYGLCVSADSVAEWDVSRFFPTLTRDQVYEVLSEKELWERVSPILYANDVLYEWRARGHEVFVVTSAWYNTIELKWECLKKYFPFIKWSDVIVTSHKQLIDGDVLIDDGPHNLIGGEYHKILFNAPHNRSFYETAHGMHRCVSWAEVFKVVSSLY